VRLFGRGDRIAASGRSEGAEENYFRPPLLWFSTECLAQSNPGTVVLVVTRVAETRPVNQIPGVPSVA
jgi:hypothetical protein